MYNKTIIRFGFCDIQNNQGLGKGYQPQPSASADNFVFLSGISHVIFVINSVSYCFYSSQKDFFVRNCDSVMMMTMIVLHQ